MLSIIIIMVISDRKTINIIIIIVSMGRRTFYNTPTHTTIQRLPYPKQHLSKLYN